MDPNDLFTAALAHNGRSKSTTDIIVEEKTPEPLRPASVYSGVNLSDKAGKEWFTTDIKKTEVTRASKLCRSISHSNAAQAFVNLSDDGSDFELLEIDQDSRELFAVCSWEGTLYIALRGTRDNQDALTNLNCFPSHAVDLGGKAHPGFVSRARELLPLINRFVTSQTTSEEKLRVVLCGHSLGGSTSHVAALLLLFNDEIDVDVVSIGFGCTFVVSRSVADDARVRGWGTRFLTIANDGDIVPCMTTSHEQLISKAKTAVGAVGTIWSGVSSAAVMFSLYF